MLTDNLVLAALERQDTVAIVLSLPQPGKPPVIVETNRAFQRLTGLATDQVSGQKLTMLMGSSNPSPEWQRLLQAITAGETLRDEIPCLTASSDLFWFGYTLTQVDDTYREERHPVLLGRDITVDRWKMQERASADALIAQAFSKIDVPVLLLAEDGRIITSNEAMANLTGHSVAELDGRYIHELTHLEDIVPASTAQARQGVDGGSYRVRLIPQAKDGGAIPVWLTSGQLDTATFGRVNVLTLMPEPTFGAPTGRVEKVSLQAVRLAFGDAWEKMSGRLLMTAESIIKQRIGPRDVFARSDDADFAIWFAASDERETAASVAVITRAIRIRLLGELGEGGLHGAFGSFPPGSTNSTLAPSPVPVAPEPRETKAMISARALEVIRSLAIDTAVEVTRIVDREDRSAGLVWADLPRFSRARLDEALAEVSEDELADAALPQPEVLHLRFALAGIKRDMVEGQKRAWLLPIPAGAMLSRRRRKRLIESLRTLQTPVQARLRGLISGLSPTLPEAALPDWLSQLGPLMQGVGVMACAPDLPGLATLRPPCGMLGLDLVSGPPPSEEAALKLFGLARRLALPVLVRTGQRAVGRRWRELGATLFAVTQS